MEPSGRRSLMADPPSSELTAYRMVKKLRAVWYVANTMLAKDPSEEMPLKGETLYMRGSIDVDAGV